jgi:hypothetical protein
VLGALFGRVAAAAVKSLAAAAVNVAATELRKPETQQKLGASLDAVTVALRDPETRNGAARALGRAAGRFRHALEKHDDEAR